MNYYTLSQACRALAINPRTLNKWLEELEIEPETPSNDKRKKRLTAGHLEQLAQWYERPLRAGESEQELHTRITALEAENAQLRHETETLRAALGSHRRDHAPASQSATAPTVRAGGLPAGWISLNAMCQTHHVNVGTAKKAMNDGAMSIERGKWRAGRNACEYALNEKQQRDFLLYFGLAEPAPAGEVKKS